MDENLRQALVNFLAQERGLAPNPLSAVSVSLNDNSSVCNCCSYGPSLDLFYKDTNGRQRYVEADDDDIYDLMLFLLKASIA